MKATAAMVLLSFCVFAQTPAPEDEKVKKQAKLEGKVLNFVSGEPVRKANVTLRPDSGGTNLKAVTDNDGKFTVENIDPGRYKLQADRQGFVTQNYGARRALGPGTTLVFNDAGAMKDVVVRLTPQGIIAGRVIDEEGEPVSGVSVQVLQYRYIMGKKRLMQAGAGMSMLTTNDLGEFRASNLAPGRYYVAISPQRLMDLQSGKEKSASKAEADGFVPTYYPNVTEASSAGAIDVGPGAEIRGMDVRMKKAHVFRVSGKVIDGGTGSPMNPAALVVFRRESGGMSTVPVSIYAVQDGKGTFELRNIPPGPYLVMVTSSNPQDLKLSMTQFDVGDQNIEDMVLTVGAGGDIPVTAKVEGVDPTAANALDLSTVRLVLQIEDNAMAAVATTVLGKDNKALLKHVNNAKYRLLVVGVPEGYYLKGARYGDADALEAGMDLTHGAAGSLDLIVAGPAAELNGVVHTEKGDAVAGAMISLVPKDAKGRTDLPKSGSSDQNGNLHLTGIVPGEYIAYAWEDIEPGAALDEDFRKPFESQGVKVKFTEGAKQSVQLTLVTREQTEEAKAKR